MRSCDGCRSFFRRMIHSRQRNHACLDRDNRTIAECRGFAQHLKLPYSILQLKQTAKSADLRCVFSLGWGLGVCFFPKIVYNNNKKNNSDLREARDIAFPFPYMVTIFLNWKKNPFNCLLNPRHYSLFWLHMFNIPKTLRFPWRRARIIAKNDKSLRYSTPILRTNIRGKPMFLVLWSALSSFHTISHRTSRVKSVRKEETTAHILSSTAQASASNSGCPNTNRTRSRAWQ